MLMILSALLVHTNPSPWNTLCNVHMLQKLLIHLRPGFIMASIEMGTLTLGHQPRIVVINH